MHQLCWKFWAHSVKEDRQGPSALMELTFKLKKTYRV